MVISTSWAPVRAKNLFKIPSITFHWRDDPLGSCSDIATRGSLCADGTPPVSRCSTRTPSLRLRCISSRCHRRRETTRDQWRTRFLHSWGRQGGQHRKMDPGGFLGGWWSCSWLQCSKRWWCLELYSKTLWTRASATWKAASWVCFLTVCLPTLIGKNFRVPLSCHTIYSVFPGKWNLFSVVCYIFLILPFREIFNNTLLVCVPPLNP